MGRGEISVALFLNSTNLIEQKYIKNFNVKILIVFFDKKMLTDIHNNNQISEFQKLIVHTSVSRRVRFLLSQIETKAKESIFRGM
ncbi:hypothetical protein [Flavobacterium foetidum]|uniref:hypothetical protein n=1 Tax=Flavobacterium foetidum TaxID=2026681 RepID=UPI00107500A7|nr:hypothetical protein [Flavobacterium foetidum]KAF2515712.1 hypothetical protein E0W73_08975 [Flavobacterium foetidum]